MEFIQEFWHVILASGVGGTVLTGILFKILPQTVIDFLFFKRKENYRAQLDQELETHKKNLSEELEKYKVEKTHEFDMLLKRKISWHEKEMEILAIVWGKLVKASASLNTSHGLYALKDEINELAQEIFEKHGFIDTSGLETISSLRKLGPDVAKTIAENFRESRDLSVAIVPYLESTLQDIQDFSNYFDSNRIFIRPGMEEKLEVVQLNAAIIANIIFMLIKMPINAKRIGDKEMEDSVAKASKIITGPIEEIKKKFDSAANELQDEIRRQLFPEEKSKNE